MGGAQLAAGSGVVRRRPQSMGSRALGTLRGLVPALVGLVGFLVFWELAVRLSGTPAFVAPTATATFERLSTELGSLLFELQFTLLSAGLGLTVGLVVGIAGAVLMAQWRILERSLFPLAVILKLVPIVAIAPLLVVWLGYTLWPKIVIAALITFFPVLVNCITGLRAVDPLALEFFQSIGASRNEILLKLRAPSATPYLFAALRISVNLSLIGALVGEYFGSDNGLGKIISQTAMRLDMRTMFATIVVLAVTGVTLNLITTTLERRAIYWHESSRTQA